MLLFLFISTLYLIFVPLFLGIKSNSLSNKSFSLVFLFFTKLLIILLFSPSLSLSCLGFLNSLTRSAYRKVFKVCSEQLKQGLIFAIIKVWQFPINESLNTKVNFDPRKGLCLFSKSKALMHSFKAKSDLFISAPSIFVFLFVSMVSTARSLPAKSIKDILL